MTDAVRPHRHRTLLAYAAATVALTTLAACSGGDPAPTNTTPPTTSAPTSTTPSSPPTTTPSAAPSTTTSVDPILAKIPSKARANTQAGAESFAQFYMEQVNRAFTKADPAALTGLANSACKTCSAFLAGAKDLEAKGQHHQGISISVDGAPANSFSPSAARIQVFVTQHSVPVVNKQGKKVEQTKAGQGIFVATLTFKDHWQVDRLQVAK